MALSSKEAFYLGDVIDQMTQNLIREVQFMVDDLRDPGETLVPLGISGSLQKSFQLEYRQDNDGNLWVGISSDKSYAENVDEKPMRHIPSADLGLKSFKDYGMDDLAPAKKDGSGYKTSKEERAYERGYRLATKGNVPTAVYAVDFIQEVLSLHGGVDGVLENL